MSRGAWAAVVSAAVLAVAATLAWQQADHRRAVAGERTLPGATLFRVKGCATCHTGPGSEARVSGPPDLSDAPAWAGHRRPDLDAAGYLRQSIREPGAFIAPGWVPDGSPLTAMPTLSVSDAEVDALVAYLLHR